MKGAWSALPGWDNWELGEECGPERLLMLQLRFPMESMFQGRLSGDKRSQCKGHCRQGEQNEQMPSNTGGQDISREV